MIKNEIKDIFDSNRSFVPLRNILNKDEMENRIILARTLAVYDTYHIKKKNIREAVYIFFSHKRRGNLGIISYRSDDGIKVSTKEMYQATKRMVLGLINSNVYCKLVKANWFPIVYCGK